MEQKNKRVARGASPESGVLRDGTLGDKEIRCKSVATAITVIGKPKVGMLIAARPIKGFLGKRRA